MSSSMVKKGMTLEIYTDGACRGNPGPGAWAFIFIVNNKIIKQEKDFIGDSTNNIAEYYAIINALNKAQKYTDGKINLYSDSQLIIRQLNGKYRINKAHLKKLYNKVKVLLKKFETVDFIHVRRDHKFIQICDSLCNEILNMHS